MALWKPNLVVFLNNFHIAYFSYLNFCFESMVNIGKMYPQSFKYTNNIWIYLNIWISNIKDGHVFSDAFPRKKKHCLISGSIRFMTSACCSSLQCASETLPTCIGLLGGDHVCYMGSFHVSYICSSSISYMLTAACIGNSTSPYLLCHTSKSSVTDLFHQDQIH